MTTRMKDLIGQARGELRYEPVERRVRALLSDETAVDSIRAILVWEPRRAVPSYAVPADDVAADVSPAAAANGKADGVLHPGIPFSVHTTAGEPVSIGGREGAGFRLADEDLAGYVELDFRAFDAWYEEDELNVGHPRDPFHRIDVVPSSRHVRVERDGEVLAESSRPYLLFEPPLPVRYYVPPDDVALDLLEPSRTRTTCAYKGHTSSYWALDGRDVAWSYAEPLREVADVAGLIAFFNERVDIAVDGAPLARPQTPWSR
jgi:uncharacterized protein (DUF427 family)